MPHSQHDKQGYRPPGILIVEDEPLIRITLSDRLQDCGLKVYETGSGEEAIRFLASGTAKIDIVFSDIQLGDGPTGFDVAEWIESHRPDIQIAVASGNARSLTEARNREHALTTVAKPYDFDALADLLHAFLARKNDPKRN